jgi:hypothetical protein
MGPGNRRSWDLHRDYLVSSPGKFRHALLDDDIVFRLVGSAIFLIAVLDNPYRGKTSVSPEPLERVYEQIMLAPK